LLEKVLKESKNKPFLADVFYYLPNTEKQPLSPQPKLLKLLILNELAAFSLLSPNDSFYFLNTANIL
jgi:hypothetical protein